MSPSGIKTLVEGVKITERDIEYTKTSVITEVSYKYF